MEYQDNNAANILVVDDITSNLMILSEMIKRNGYIARPVTSARQAMTAIEVRRPDLILLDISMPDMDGYEFCELLKENIKTRDIPIIFISAMNQKEDKIKGFKLGAADFISKPFEMEEVTMRINNQLKLYKIQQQLEGYNTRLNKMVSDKIKKILEEEKNFIYMMAKLGEQKEDPDGGHIRNIGRYSKILAMSLQLSPKFEKRVSNLFIENIEVAAPLHDIGKISISDKVLLKPGALTAEEMNLVKQHTVIGADLLQELCSMNEYNTYLKMATDIARFHHEKWDGSGYPLGLCGEEIPLCARIASIVDVYDILTSKKCYKEAYRHEQCVDIINDEAGKSFDRDIVEIFNKIQNQFRKR